MLPSSQDVLHFGEKVQELLVEDGDWNALSVCRSTDVAANLPSGQVAAWRGIQRGTRGAMIP